MSIPALARCINNVMTIPVNFTAQGHPLSGTLHLPGTRRPPVVVGSHGLLGTQDSAKQVAMAEACVNAGLAYLRFDHRGCGRSAPPPPGIELLTGRIDDLLAAVNWVRNEPRLGGRFAFFGSSMGGAVCLASAPQCHPAALVTWAAPVSLEGIDPNRPETRLPGGTAIAPFDLSGHLAGIRRVLVCHGEKDQVVPVAHANRIFEAVSSPRERLFFPNAGHMMSRPEDQRRFIHDATAWLTRHLTAPLSAGA